MPGDVRGGRDADPNARNAVEAVWRIESARLNAGLARFCGDIGLAEELAQDALVAALEQWPETGVPDNPGAWLMTTAKNRGIDKMRRAENFRHKVEELGRDAELRQADSGSAADEAFSDHVGDEMLALVFTTCHPVLTPESQVALTLRLLGGLTTPEIARSFLVSDATVGQRISRAKKTLAEAHVPIETPGPDELPERLAGVLGVVYLIFNEGYSSTSGPDLQRVELTAEAIRLARELHRLLPDDHEVAGLLALLLLTDARRPARTGPGGELVPMAEQDRSIWDTALIAEGTALVSSSLAATARFGPFLLQAAIAAVHDEAPSDADTDWPQILALYGVLLSISDNPMVRLNHAIATAMVDGPAAGLAELATLDETLAEHHRLHAVRAHLLEMAGDRAGAAEHYRAAAARTGSVPEQRYLTLRAAQAAN